MKTAEEIGVAVYRLFNDKELKAIRPEVIAKIIDLMLQERTDALEAAAIWHEDQANSILLSSNIGPETMLWLNKNHWNSALAIRAMKPVKS